MGITRSGTAPMMTFVSGIFLGKSAKKVLSATTNKATTAGEGGNDAPEQKKVSPTNDTPGEYAVEYILEKRRPGRCANDGMFWRSDPSGETWLETNRDSPKDGATLRGDVKIVDGKKKWLHVKWVKQYRGHQQWTDAPANAYLPFRCDEDHFFLSERPVAESSRRTQKAKEGESESKRVGGYVVAEESKAVAEESTSRRNTS